MSPEDFCHDPHAAMRSNLNTPEDQKIIDQHQRSIQASEEHRIYEIELKDLRSTFRKNPYDARLRCIVLHQAKQIDKLEERIKAMEKSQPSIEGLQAAADSLYMDNQTLMNDE